MNITQNAVVALLCSFVVTIPIVVKHRYAKTYATKVIEQASKEGTVVTGHRIWKRYYPTVRDRQSGWEYKAKYRYEVNGRSYVKTKHFRKGSYPPKDITFYYKKGRPGKVYSGTLDKLGVKYSLLMWLPVLVFLFIFSILQIASMDWMSLMQG